MEETERTRDDGPELGRFARPAGAVGDATEAEVDGERAQRGSAFELAQSATGFGEHRKPVEWA